MAVTLVAPAVAVVVGTMPLAEAQAAVWMARVAIAAALVTRVTAREAPLAGPLVQMRTRSTASPGT